MKLLYVISSMDPRKGGPVNGVRMLIGQDAARGQVSEILCSDSPDADFLTDLPARVHALGPGRGTYSFNPKLTAWLRANASDYDAVVINGLWQFHSLAVWWALRGMACRYFVFPHGMLGTWFKREYVWKHRKKWLYWMLVERRVLRDARCVLFTCNEEMGQAPDAFPYYQCDALVVGYSASEVPANHRELLQEWRSRHPGFLSKRVFLVLGRLHPVKGCDLALRAFAQVAGCDPTLHLVFAGPDDLQIAPELKQLSESLGVGGRTHWVGMLDEKAKWGAILSAEALLAPSHHENFGVAIAEALSCGKPVLISNQVNIWREIHAAQAGLVDDDTVDGTVRLLKGWLELSDGERARMGVQARSCYQSRFSVAQFATRFRRVLAEKTAEPSPTVKIAKAQIESE